MLSSIDPHPGNMLRTNDGKLAILDFGLMTEITDNQKYGMVEAIAHLINRDYTEIGQDFINLDFIPEGTDTTPIVPALTTVFDVALAGGGAKSINFQELAGIMTGMGRDAYRKMMREGGRSPDGNRYKHEWNEEGQD